MTGKGQIVYHFAVLRVVPHVHLGAFANIGVIVHARTSEYLAMRSLTDSDELRRVAPGVDTDRLVQYLRRFADICAGEATGGPIALLPPSERFHWLTAPRSDVLQTSPIHEGLCSDPAAALDKLFTEATAR